MPPFNDYTWNEIQSQPAAWDATLAHMLAQADTLAAFLRTSGAEQAVFTGCGSTYYLAVAAAAANLPVPRRVSSTRRNGRSDTETTHLLRRQHNNTHKHTRRHKNDK